MNTIRRHICRLRIAYHVFHYTSFRTNEHLVHRDYWEIMKLQFDNALKWTWEELAEGGVSAHVFLLAHAGPSGLYHDVDVLKRMLATSDSESDSIAELIHKVVGESSLGKSMFTVKWIKASRAIDKKEVEKGIRVLIDHSFDNKEVETFKLLMKTQCADLLQHGHKKLERIMTEIHYFGEKLSIVVESPEEEWDMRLSCSLRSWAINSGQIEMLPWEILLFEKDGLPDYPKFLKVPEQLLQQCLAPRLAAADFLTDEDDQLSKMINIMVGKRNMCLELDRSFMCDMTFLEKKAEGLLRNKLHNEVLACLPSMEKPMTLMESNKALPTCQGDFTSLESVVCNILGSYSSGLQTTHKYSRFFQLALKRVELFLSCKMQKKPDGKPCGTFPPCHCRPSLWRVGFAAFVQTSGGGHGEGESCVSTCVVTEVF